MLGTIGHVFPEGNIYIKSNPSLSQISNTLGVQDDRGRFRIRNKGRGSSVPCHSSSEHEGSIDDRVASRKKRLGVKKHRSPPLPKMAVFKGEVRYDWLAFQTQFERIAVTYGWSGEDKLSKLI